MPVRGLISFLTVLSVLIWLPGVAQEPATEKTAASPGLTVDSVIEMHQAGISDTLIVAKIKQNNKPFNLSVDEMLKLKKAGITDSIVQAMMNPSIEIKALVDPNPGPPEPIEPPTPPPDPNNPDVPHGEGIYFVKNIGGKTEMVKLELASYSGTRKERDWTGVRSTKIKGIIQGKKASIKSSEGSPVFYFYFENKAAGFGNGGYFGEPGAITSPNRFSCIKLDVRKNTRETTVATESSLTHSVTVGTDPNAIRSFKSDKIREGVYKVTFPTDLEPGEYAFLTTLGMAGTAMPYNGFFDFCIGSGE